MLGLPDRGGGRAARAPQVGGAQQQVPGWGRGHSPGSGASFRRRRRLALRDQDGPRPRPAPRTFGFPSPQALGGARSWAGVPEKEGKEAVGGGSRGLAQPGLRGGVASGPLSCGAGGLGRARLRGEHCGGRANCHPGRRRPPSASEEGEPGERVRVLEERHGGEAGELGWPPEYQEEGGARRRPGYR